MKSKAPTRLEKCKSKVCARRLAQGFAVASSVHVAGTAAVTDTGRHNALALLTRPY